MVTHENTPAGSERAPRRYLAITIATLSLGGLIIILFFRDFSAAAIAIPVLSAFSIVSLYSAGQLLRGSALRPKYIMRSSRGYPVAIAIFGVGGLIYAIITSINSSSPTMIGIYFIVLATGLRGLYERRTTARE